jgi:hypothetical protein
MTITPMIVFCALINTVLLGEIIYETSFGQITGSK